ncbi:G- coupled receptor 128 [Pelobates cultripes]|uniref:G- coupled receptor 128, partial n=1 Tax=Pelobates cultripes TaxID=61616 RepID=A0AAD1QZN2_PELCU|nr:G- coupled receptor 128 [Pelobates cultripes]
MVRGELRLGIHMGDAEVWCVDEEERGGRNVDVLRLLREPRKNPLNYPTIAPPTSAPCNVECENEGVCNNNNCICPDKWTGEFCTIPNFCGNSTECIIGSDGSQECLTFEEVLVGRYVYSNEQCESSTVSANTSKAFRQCTLSGGIPVLQNISVQFCNVTLQSLANMTDVTEDASKIAASTQILTSQPANLNATDISNAMIIVNRILNNTETPTVAPDVVVSAVTTVSQILNANTDEYDNSDVTQNAESLTMAMESFAQSNSTSNIAVVQPNVAVQNTPLPTGSSGGVLFTSLRGLGEDDNLASNRIIVKENASELLIDKMAEVQIFVSSQSDSYNKGTVGFVLYQNDNFFRSKKHTPKISLRKRIISASLSSGTLGNIQFIFNPQHDPLYILRSYTCVFWDYKLSDWNTKGCSNVENDKGLLQCSCNHTTNFAVLMSFKKHSHYKALGIVSTVGCALSIAGLAITIVFQILQREKQQTKWILLCLFISMLIFNIIFITGVENNQPNSTDIEKHPDEIPKTDLIEPPENRSCTAVAVLLHYFLLTTFLWTAVSAALMYRQLVQIKHTLPSHLTMYSIITAWGLPAVFVGITFGATYSSSPSHYRQEEFCWLATLNTAGHFDYGKPMFWSFLLPVGIILAMNVFIFVALMVKVTWKKEDETLRR